MLQRLMGNLSRPSWNHPASRYRLPVLSNGCNRHDMKAVQNDLTRPAWTLTSNRTEDNSASSLRHSDRQVCCGSEVVIRRLPRETPMSSAARNADVVSCKKRRCRQLRETPMSSAARNADVASREKRRCRQLRETPMSPAARNADAAIILFECGRPNIMFCKQYVLPVCRMKTFNAVFCDRQRVI